MDNLNICRVCESLRDLENIFKPGNEEIPLLLQSIANVSVDSNDYLPKCICMECLLDLRKAHRFKIKCEKTDRKYRFEYLFSQSQTSLAKQMGRQNTPDKGYSCLSKELIVDENYLSSDEDFMDSSSIKVEIVDSEKITQECPNNSQNGPTEQQEKNSIPIKVEESEIDAQNIPTDNFPTSKNSTENYFCNDDFNSGLPSSTIGQNGNELLQQVLEETKFMKGLLESQVNHLVYSQMENTRLLKRVLNVDVSQSDLPCKFPITNLEDLQKLEIFLESESDGMVALVRHLLTPGGIMKRLDSVFDIRLLLKFNYDGTRGKKSFRDLKNINSMLFRAIRNDNYDEQDYTKEMKIALRLMKNRHHKRTCHLRKKMLLIS